LLGVNDGACLPEQDEKEERKKEGKRDSRAIIGNIGEAVQSGAGPKEIW
jgi:hypothetical protein